MTTLINNHFLSSRILKIHELYEMHIVQYLYRLKDGKLSDSLIQASHHLVHNIAWVLHQKRHENIRRLQTWNNLPDHIRNNRTWLSCVCLRIIVLQRYIQQIFTGYMFTFLRNPYCNLTIISN